MFNYRHITVIKEDRMICLITVILSVISKILERVVHDQLLKYIEKKQNFIEKPILLQKKAFDRTGNFISCG